MSNSDLVVLDEVLRQKKAEVSPQSEESEFFELFVFEQVLKNLDLSNDELEEGRTDGGNDGGIDGFFTFVNQDLVKEIVDRKDMKRHPEIDVYVIQSTAAQSFGEVVLDKFLATSQDVFDLNKSVDSLSGRYNGQVLEAVALFRETFLALATRHPVLHITFIYACKGDTSQINANLKHRKDTLIETVKDLMSDSMVEARFLGARELLNLSRIEKTYTLRLQFSELLSKGSDDFSNYVVLSSLLDYFRFITDEVGNLRKYVFDSNVRDFQGDVEVNRDISEALARDDKLDFWWLNNGITILASEPSIAGNSIHLDDVQIINGLQTTTCIYNHFREMIKKGSQTSDTRDRSILVKIINVKDPDARDRIIKATNFQTAIPPASFKAMDPVHRNIETYFRTHDWYYDRRKNFYKNLGKPLDRIVGIELMAQAVMAMIVREPQTARGRPTSILKTQHTPALFNEDFPPQLYLFCAQVIKGLEKYLKTEIDDFTRQEKTNLKFHIAMLLMMKATGRRDYSIEDVSRIKIEEVNERLLYESTKLTVDLAREYMKANNTSMEKLAKSKPFVDFMSQNAIAVPP
jgi:hypothetical protein